MNHRAASAPEHRAPNPGDTVRAAGVEYLSLIHISEPTRPY